MIHKHTSTQAQFAVTPVCCFVVVCSLLGCGPVTDAPIQLVAAIEASGDHSPGQCVIDAGIVFADEASYLCVPLNGLGIALTEDVLSVHISCECTRASIVQFSSSIGGAARALRIDFRAEPTTVHTNRVPHPSHLSVKVILQLSGGRTQEVAIQFLHTTRDHGNES